jgi:hypothetical protein
MSGNARQSQSRVSAPYCGHVMLWARMLAYVTGRVDQELPLRNEYLAAENRILKAQIKGRLLLSEEEKATFGGDRQYAFRDPYFRRPPKAVLCGED